MQDEHAHVRDLLNRYLENRLEPEEFDELWKALGAGKYTGEPIDETLQALWIQAASEEARVPDARWDAHLEHLLGPDARPEASGPVKRMRSLRWLAAASIVLVAAAGVWLYFRGAGLDADRFAGVAGRIVPGGNRALLQLANGQRITLDSLSAGLVAQPHGARVMNFKNGSLAYLKSKEASGEVSYNLLTTPRGGKYRLTLSDGTRVWLNAASSIRFPTVFGKDKREVDIGGEAYFEVAPNPHAPFVVHAGGFRLKVLGTSFNVQAYPDEATINTTLVTGAVLVTDGDADIRLKPGQQVLADGSGRLDLIPHADVDAAIAWKNDLFWFDDEDIATVMRKIARWYNVDVEFRGKVREHFTGSLSRSSDVSRVFKLLGETGAVHFQVQDRKIIVSP